MDRMQTKVKKTYNILLRIIILLTTYGFLYIKIFYGKDWHAQYLMFSSLLEKPGVKYLLLIVVFLMLVNWSIESGKWRFMIQKIERVTFLHSLQAVFAGLSISFFTPNRTGEYVGRAFILDKASHVEGILITVLGSMSQLFITILAGTLALLVFVPEYMINSRIFPDTLFFGFAFLVILMDLLLFFLLVNVQFLSVLRDKLLRSRLKKFRKHLTVFAGFSPKEMIAVMGLCLLRYIVFTGQFFLLLKIFSVPVRLYDGILITSLIFLALSIVPTVTITELGVRNSLAVYFFGFYFNHSAAMTVQVLDGIILAGSLLWIINLVIPAILGTLFISRLKFFRKNAQVI